MTELQYRLRLAFARTDGKYSEQDEHKEFIDAGLAAVDVVENSSRKRVALTEEGKAAWKIAEEHRLKSVASGIARIPISVSSVPATHAHPGNDTVVCNDGTVWFQDDIGAWLQTSVVPWVIENPEEEAQS